MAVWTLLDGVLYGEHSGAVVPDEKMTEERPRHRERWASFDFLTNWGEQFDGWKAFVVCPPGGSVRILSRELPKGALRCVDVSRASVMEAIKDFSQWFEENARDRQSDAGATGAA